MLKALTFGLAVGVGIQALRNWPAPALVSADAMAVVFIVGVVAAYFAGRARRPAVSASASAVAEATATASASNQVNVAVVIPGAGAGAMGGGVAVPTSTAPWLGEPSALPELTIDHLEGMDLSEVIDSQAEHEPRF